MCEIDLEPCEVWVPSVHRAAKEHRCDCCGAAIRPGQRYHRTFTIFEGDASTSKHCRRCDSALHAFGKAHDGMTPSPIGFDDVLDECIAERDEGYQTWMRVRAAIRRRRDAAPSTVGLAGSAAAARDPQGVSGPRRG